MFIIGHGGVLAIFQWKKNLLEIYKMYIQIVIFLYTKTIKGKGVMDMAKEQINIRLDDLHVELLDMMVEKLKHDGVKTNRTDVIQKALYSFARDNVLEGQKIMEIIDKHYR
jgi:hypothetical protein